MKIIHQQNNHYTLSFAKGEEVISGIKAFAEENNIQAAHIAGLGAAHKLELAYYNIATKEYERHPIIEEVEVLNLNGNIGLSHEQKTIVHMHGTFGKKDLSVFGGHVFSMEISGAGEIHITAFEGTINRAFDAETGLTLMCNVPTV